MNELEMLLNKTDDPKQTATESPKKPAKPTAAANKANSLADQEKAIAAASIGSAVFRSAAAFLAATPPVREYQK